jgi:hypothetical protein
MERGKLTHDGKPLTTTNRSTYNSKRFQAEEATPGKKEMDEFIKLEKEVMEQMD